MGLLDSIRKEISNEGICESCGNLVSVGSGLIGCKAHDKLIIPTHPPYWNTNSPCADWIKEEE